MANATCSTNGCDKPRRRGGLCGGCYQAMRRAQDPTYNRYEATCAGCGQTFWAKRRDGKICSDACRSVVQRERGGVKRVSRLPSDHPVMLLIREAGAERQRQARAAQVTDFRRAVEGSDYQCILAEVERRATLTGAGCWQWTKRNKDGYPIHRFGRRTVLVHRLVVEAKHGAPLGKQAAHHICANTMCVNPAHLQPVTARANTAEMLARTYMESRIADLEAALALVAPAHPLLAEVGVAKVS